MCLWLSLSHSSSCSVVRPRPLTPVPRLLRLSCFTLSIKPQLLCRHSVPQWSHFYSKPHFWPLLSLLSSSGRFCCHVSFFFFFLLKYSFSLIFTGTPHVESAFLGSKPATTVTYGSVHGTGNVPFVAQRA